ncbi:hypothetical protein [Symbioplanes lichenis]|uniref:hypothetical protein n=1 Tax=Symbioplanes lichenis TaxID=1629072 RepID=UPI0027395E2B|nr:hypothetical protein [Actinoplanes lichenis]
MGTVSGLALLAGGTAVAAVAGGTHSVFATVLLGMLTVGMSHALLTEIRRQARRRNVDGWAAQDTVNTVLLASWSSGALIATLLAVAPASVRAVGLLLTLGYAVSCAYFVAERCRTIADAPPEPTEATPSPAPAVTHPPTPTVTRPSTPTATRPSTPTVTQPPAPASAEVVQPPARTAHVPAEPTPTPATDEAQPAKVPAESA